MLVVFHGIDRADSANVRASTRPAHLEFQAGRNNLFGGPLRNYQGDVCGTIIVFEASDLDTAATELANDPYILAGLFEHTSITEFVGDRPTF